MWVTVLVFQLLVIKLTGCVFKTLQCFFGPVTSKTSLINLFTNDKAFFDTLLKIMTYIDW